MTASAHRNQLRYPILWAAVDGAIRDAARHHPDILIPDKRLSSIVKRVVGQVLGLHGPGAGKPADTADGAIVPPDASGVEFTRAEGAGLTAGQPQRRPSRRRRAQGMFPWSATALDAHGRRALHAFLRIERTRFVAFHRGPGLIFVEVRR